MADEGVYVDPGPSRAARGAPGLLRIADAARAVGVSPSALRLWERQGLVTPIRDGGRERRYGPHELTRLRCIRSLRVEEALNAAGIRRALGDGGSAGPAAAPTALGAGPGATGAPATDGAATAGPDVVGGRLRTLRTVRGLSLRQAGARTGLSPSFLSGLERGTTVASLAALIRLAGAYETTVAALLGSGAPDDDAVGARPTRVVRSDARSAMDAGRGVRLEELAVRPARLQPHLVVLAPGASSDGAYDHAGEEFLFVLSGRIVVWLEDHERHELGPGDALTFPSSLPHRFVALGRDETRVLWVNTPPSL